MKKMLEQILKALGELEGGDNVEEMKAIQNISESTMDLMAKLNWKYFESLQEQGFSSEQALQLVIANLNTGS